MLIHLFGFVTFILILPIKCERLNSIGSTKTSSMNASILVDLDNDDIDTTKDNYSKYRSMKECPFPPAYIIDPCKCFADERYRTYLVCNLERKMDADFLSNLIDSFGCKNEIFSFEVNLNGFAWETDFSRNNFSQIENGAFANLLKLKEIRISKSTISVLQS